MLQHQSVSCFNPGEYVSLIYADRMRTAEDKRSVLRLYDGIFSERYPSYQSVGRYQITSEEIRVGRAAIKRNYHGDKVGST